MYATDNPKSRAFLDDLVEVYQRHGLSLSHEDGHGAFIVAPFSQRNVSWLFEAFDKTETEGA